MCKAFRCLSVCGAVLFAFVGLSACGGDGDSGHVVARVGGYPITKATLDHWLSIQADTNDKTASAHKMPSETLKQRVLGSLISSQWTTGEAAELGVR